MSRIKRINIISRLLSRDLMMHFVVGPALKIHELSQASPAVFKYINMNI